MNTRQSGGLLKRKKKSAEDKAFTPEKVQQRVKEYEAVKNKKKPEPKTETKPASTTNEKFDENEGVSFNQAFKKATDTGNKLFKWKGKMYRADKKQMGGALKPIPPSPRKPMVQYSTPKPLGKAKVRKPLPQDSIKRSLPPASKYPTKQLF